MGPSAGYCRRAPSLALCRFYEGGPACSRPTSLGREEKPESGGEGEKPSAAIPPLLTSAFRQQPSAKPGDSGIWSERRGQFHGKEYWLGNGQLLFSEPCEGPPQLPRPATVFRIFAKGMDCIFKLFIRSRSDRSISLAPVAPVWRRVFRYW